MHFIYILKSEKNDRYYIGSTGDVEKRLFEHNSGKTKSLKYLRPLKIVFQKSFLNENEARKIERKLKKFKNRTIIDRIVAKEDLIMGP